jgi:hypothetical protein
MLAVLATLCGCEVFGNKSSSELGGNGPERNPDAAQSELMSFASTFITTITQQWNQAAGQQTAATAATPGTPGTASTPGSPSGQPTERSPADRARRAALEIKNANVSNAIAIATGPNPTVGIGDMITLVTLQRMLLEDAQTQSTFGPERAAALVAAYKDQETKAWRMGARVYSPDQLDQLRELITEWRQQNPNQRYIAGVRLEDFARDRRNSVVEESRKVNSLLALVGLDPLANLDPTVREVQRSRLLAERMFFYAQFAPQIIKGQTESMYTQFLSTPEIKRALSSFDQTADAIDAIGAVADDLPKQLATERHEAIEELFENLKRERTETLEQFGQIVRREREAFLADIDSRQETFRSTLRELRDTVKASEGLSESVKGTIQEAGDLVTKVSPEPDPNAPAAPAPKPKDPNEPDAMEKYQAAIAQTAVTAEKLTELAERVNKILESPQLDAKAGNLRSVVDTVQNTVEDTAGKAFWGLVALAIISAALFGAAVMFALVGHKAWERRRIAKRIRKHHTVRP